MLSISQIQSQVDLDDVRELLVEYLSWATGLAKELYNQDVDLEAMIQRSFSEIEEFFPPWGRLLLARQDGQPAGVGFLKKIREDTCEIKRMYVRPAFRGKGIGRELLDQLIQDAEAIGYAKILLDSTKFMKAAHSLYRSAGFQEINLYPETEMTEDFQQHMVYMELDL